MKNEKYIVEIEMPDGDSVSSVYIQDVIQSDCDIEDKGRWKVSVKKYWKPSKVQMETLEYYMHTLLATKHKEVLFVLYNDLKQL